MEEWLEWKLVEYNRVADHLCNVVLESGCAVEEDGAQLLRQAWQAGHYVHAYSDGGFKAGALGSAAWVVYAVRPCGTELLWDKIAWRAFPIVLDPSISAFTCETLALEDLLEYVNNILM